MEAKVSLVSDDRGFKTHIEGIGESAVLRWEIAEMGEVTFDMRNGGDVGRECDTWHCS